MNVPSIYYKLDHALPFKDLRAMLLLAMKYQVEEISIEAIDRLEACYPFSQLPDYDCEQIRDRDGPPWLLYPRTLSQSSIWLDSLISRGFSRRLSTGAVSLIPASCWTVFATGGSWFDYPKRTCADALL